MAGYGHTEDLHNLSSVNPCIYIFAFLYAYIYRVAEALLLQEREADRGLFDGIFSPLRGEAGANADKEAGEVRRGILGPTTNIYVCMYLYLCLYQIPISIPNT